MYMSLGAGTIHDFPMKQKVKTSTNTHTQLVGVSDALPEILWCCYFMEAQSYTVENEYIHQDNQGAILLEKNGSQSIDKGSRHIKIKHFFISDKVKEK